MSFIVIEKLLKKYRLGSTETTVLNGISFTIRSGELLAIVGASGSGKSTLMNIIGLLDKADAGQYYLKGKDVTELSANQLAYIRNQQIGFVFQQFNLLPRLNALQNVALPLTYRPSTQQDNKEKAFAALARVGMANFVAHRPNELSGGQQQRVAIARALVTEPEVILADEPTGALDSRTGNEIMQLFLELNREGRTLILVTHDLQIAKRCFRCIHLADGNIVNPVDETI